MDCKKHDTQEKLSLRKHNPDMVNVTMSFKCQQFISDNTDHVGDQFEATLDIK